MNWCQLDAKTCPAMHAEHEGFEFFQTIEEKEMKEKLLKFFNKYERFFDNEICSSTGDSDDILMDLMQIINKDDVDLVIGYLKGEK